MNEHQNKLLQESKIKSFNRNKERRSNNRLNLLSNLSKSLETLSSNDLGFFEDSNKVLEEKFDFLRRGEESQGSSESSEYEEDGKVETVGEFLRRKEENRSDRVFTGLG